MKTTFKFKPLWHVGLFDLEAKVATTLKNMIHPKTDPQLQVLFKQAQAYTQAAIGKAEALRPLENATNAMLDIAEATEQVAETLTASTDNVEETSPLDYTAGAAAEVAEAALLAPPQVVNAIKPPIISRLWSSATTSSKTLPGKLFLLAILAYHHEHNRLVNINFYLTGKKKVVVIEIGANDRLKRFKFMVSPGNQLRFLDNLPFDYFSNDPMPSFANTTSLVGRLFSPLTGLFYPKINEHRLYHVTVQDDAYNPFLANGPLIKSIELSADEMLRITHMSTYQLDHAKHSPAQLNVTAEEEVESKSPDDELDTIHLINITVQDDEQLMYLPLPDLSGNGEKGYIRVTQEPLG